MLRAAIILSFMVFLAPSSYAIDAVPQEVKNAFCDALEYAMDHPDDFDNDVSQCAYGYTRDKCIEGSFRIETKDLVSGSVKDITCDCGAKVTEKKDGTLSAIITGCL